jgi:hypothetical protein
MADYTNNIGSRVPLYSRRKGMRLDWKRLEFNCDFEQTIISDNIV